MRKRLWFCASPLVQDVYGPMCWLNLPRSRTAGPDLDAGAKKGGKPVSPPPLTLALSGARYFHTCMNPAESPP
jgi:hypothetical protein